MILERGGPSLLLSIKTRSICVHTHNVFPSFLSLWVPQKWWGPDHAPGPPPPHLDPPLCIACQPVVQILIIGNNDFTHSIPCHFVFWTFAGQDLM